MTDKDYLIIFQIVVSALLSLSIVFQQRGSGLSSTFGGGGGFYASRRGAEKILHYATVVFAVLFLGNAALFLFL